MQPPAVDDERRWAWRHVQRSLQQEVNGGTVTSAYPPRPGVVADWCCQACRRLREGGAVVAAGQNGQVV